MCGPDVRYFALLPLNERSDFSGGEILVRKTPNAKHYTQRGGNSSNSKATLSEGSESDQSEADDEDEEEEEDQMELRTAQKTLRPKYDKFTRFTPDKGSIVILNGKLMFIQ